MALTSERVRRVARHGWQKALENCTSVARSPSAATPSIPAPTARGAVVRGPDAPLRSPDSSAPARSRLSTKALPSRALMDKCAARVARRRALGNDLLEPEVTHA
ncbi:hypothetical protein GCM10009863_34650 [Streptomyces axinellae]|uniref:Uncharacterized protein n=1 Tax=Streptomyces axinellae TaxID=552788 RepID=A0ABN3Q5Y8_9ACTN